MMELQLRDISKSWPGGIQALNNINLTIGAGIYGLSGNSGAGKTTLLRIVAGLVAPDSGNITVNRTGIPEQPAGLRQLTGIMPQSFSVYPGLSAEGVLHHLALTKGPASRRARRDMVASSLRRAGLWEVRRLKLCRYSATMKQQLKLAAALLGDPEILILDEPTAGLDAAGRTAFLAIISALVGDRIVLVAAQQVEDIRALSSRLAVIARGEILLDAPPQQAKT